MKNVLTQKPILFKKTNREDIAELKFESFVNELKIKAPLLCGALIAATINNNNSHNKKSNFWIPTITVAEKLLPAYECIPNIGEHNNAPFKSNCKYLFLLYKM